MADTCNTHGLKCPCKQGELLQKQQDDKKEAAQLKITTIPLQQEAVEKETPEKAILPPGVELKNMMVRSYL
jgi:hypothetical protein